MHLGRGRVDLNVVVRLSGGRRAVQVLLAADSWHRRSLYASRYTFVIRQESSRLLRHAYV
jgi:hypothetical protein